MSLLTDRQIEQLCIAPNAEIASEIGRSIAYFEPDHLTDLKANPAMSVRDLTDDERAAFPVMIAPFESEQVRYEHSETLEAFQERMRLLIVQLPEGHPDAARNYLDINWQGDMVDNKPVAIYTKKVISYGLSSMGYDLRVGNKFYIFTNINTTVIDPKSFDLKNYVEYEGEVCIIPPNSFVLARSIEYLKMPPNVLGEVLSKSTYARCGLNCLATPLEPGWEGHVTLEFANNTSSPAMLYAGEGACQVLFHEASETPRVTYADRKGKYQGQTGITLPKV